MTSRSYIPTAAAVLAQEADALRELAASLSSEFDEAVRLLYGIEGRVAATGMGKSGHVARKVAATLASTGSPAFFIHPSEASHGDLGMLTSKDAVIAFSNSGETSELEDILVFASRTGIPVIAVTQNSASFLARHADCRLILPTVPEACPLGCAPTTSTTMMLALGDALALSLIEARGFSREDFHGFHPGGKLGRKLLQVKDIMHGIAQLPLTGVDTPMSEVLCVMTGGGFGCACIVDGEKLAGIVTDGDLRRHMEPGLLGRKAREVMTPNPVRVDADLLAVKALHLMQARSITSLLVVEGDRPVGIVHIHDCLRAGLQ